MKRWNLLGESSDDYGSRDSISSASYRFDGRAQLRMQKKELVFVRFRAGKGCVPTCRAG